MHAPAGGGGSQDTLGPADGGPTTVPMATSTATANLTVTASGAPSDGSSAPQGTDAAASGATPDPSLDRADCVNDDCHEGSDPPSSQHRARWPCRERRPRRRARAPRPPSLP